MQDDKYAGNYGVEQQLKLLSKWLSESGFGEAALLVSAAAMSVQDMTGQKSVPTLTRPPSIPERLAPERLTKPIRALSPAPADELHEKRRAGSV
jgi:hypothetical protein